MRLKDHIIRDVVTNLRDVAIEFHAAGQLRERLRHALEPLLTQGAAMQVERIAPAPAAAPQVLADERAAFDVWASRSNTYHVSGYNPHDDLWRAWQARAAIAAAPVQAQEPVARVSDRFASDDGTNDEITAYLPVGTALYRAPVQPVAVPDGWKLVPAEPTDEMAVAAIKVTLGNVAINGVDQYRAMIAAAPAAPAAQCDAKGAERIVALLEAIRDGVPLEEPVSVCKAMMARRQARVVLDKGVGPLAAVHLVNIGVGGWVHTETTAAAYADGFNRGADWLRSSIIEYADKLPSASAAVAAKAAS